MKDSAPWALASLASMPLLVLWLGGSGIVFWVIAATLAVMVCKRLEANRRPLPLDARERRRVLWLRLVFDRDIPDHQAWIRREL